MGLKLIIINRESEQLCMSNSNIILHFMTKNYLPNPEASWPKTTDFNVRFWKILMKYKCGLPFKLNGGTPLMKTTWHGPAHSPLCPAPPAYTHATADGDYRQNICRGQRSTLKAPHQAVFSSLFFICTSSWRGGGCVRVVHTPGGLGRKEGCTPGSWTPQRSWRGWLTEDSPVDSALLFTPGILTLLASLWRSSSLNYWDARFQTRAPHLCSR